MGDDPQRQTSIGEHTPQVLDPIVIGTIIDERYEIVEYLGAGGFATVVLTSV